MKKEISVNDCSFRLLSGQDTEKLYRYFQSLSDATRSIFSNRGFSMADAEAFTGAELGNPAVRRYIVSITENDEEIIIACAYFRSWDRMVPWFGISVRDDVQGKGLGKRIIEYSIEEAQKYGKGGILLSTAKTNSRAQALYQRYGFKVLGEECNIYKELVFMLNFPDTRI